MSRSKASLAFQGLDASQLSEFIPDLCIQSELTELDLSGNRLASLPPTMSQLSNLKVLNISQNPFYDFELLLAVLQSMNGLETLNIDIEGPAQEDKEDLLILGLPKLKYFNGLSLMEGDEAHTSSSTNNNTTSSLASSTTPLALGNSTIVPLPITQQLTNSASTNNPPAPQQQPKNSLAAPSSTTSTLEETDLESAALLFGAVKDLMGSLAPEDDARLTEAFDVHVKTVIRTLKSKLDGVTDQFIQRGEILMAKHELYEVCFAEVINVASSSSPKFGAVLRKLRDIHKDLFSEFPATLHEMRPHYLQRLSDMKSQVVRAERESSLLLEAAEVLEKEAIQHSNERDSAQLQASNMSSQLAAQEMSMEMSISSNNARSMVVQATSRTPTYSSPNPQTSLSKRPIKSSFQAAMSGPLPAEATPGGGAFGPSSGPPRSARSASKAGKPQRVLSLKQLKEQFVSLIYDSKMKFDRKCKDAHLPRETMEMHMYTFLNQRYGLKSLIVEHASAIIQAVNKYSTIDNDVLVFGKVIRNEIDEEFRFVQKQLKETVVELLRVKLKGTYQLKTDAQIGHMVVSRCRGYVEPEEWKDIIRYMYNHEDGLAIMVLVEECIHFQPSLISPLNMPGADTRGRRRVSVVGEQSMMTKAVGGGRVPFEDFLKILLDFQLAGHEKFLSKFRRLFREVDTDKNGVVNEPEFRDMVLRMDPNKNMVSLDRMMQMVDPYNNQHITFSEAVGALSAELVSMMTAKRS